MVKKSFQNDGLCFRRLAITGKVEISEKLKAEIESLLVRYCTKFSEHKIPSSMKINLDQATSKFVPGCNKTLAKKVVNQYQSLAQQKNE